MVYINLYYIISNLGSLNPNYFRMIQMVILSPQTINHRKRSTTLDHQPPNNHPKQGWEYAMHCLVGVVKLHA